MNYFFFVAVICSLSVFFSTITPMSIESPAPFIQISLIRYRPFFPPRRNNPNNVNPLQESLYKIEIAQDILFRSVDELIKFLGNKAQELHPLKDERSWHPAWNANYEAEVLLNFATKNFSTIYIKDDLEKEREDTIQGWLKVISVSDFMAYLNSTKIDFSFKFVQSGIRKVWTYPLHSHLLKHQKDNLFKEWHVYESQKDKSKYLYQNIAHKNVNDEGLWITSFAEFLSNEGDQQRNFIHQGILAIIHQKNNPGSVYTSWSNPYIY